MIAVVLKCCPGSRFHFGKYAPDTDTALNDSNSISHSDTVFAALVNTWQDSFGNAEDIVGAFRDGKLTISSLFFCIEQNKNYKWFLPKPVTFNLFRANEYKLFRRVRYISKKTWETIIDPAELVNETEYLLLGGKSFSAKKDELEADPDLDKNQQEQKLSEISLYRIETLPKVKVRDAYEDRGIFQMAVTEIPDNSQNAPDLLVHYYFLLDNSRLDQGLEEKLLTVVKALEYTGIGAERSTIGKIEGIDIVYDWEIEMKDKDPSFSATASLLSPSPGELGKIKYYKTIMRGGRRLGKPEGDERKDPVFLKSVRMIAEGAIVPRGTKGQLADVTPENDHRIFLRHGMPLCLPVRSQWIPQ